MINYKLQTQLSKMNMMHPIPNHQLDPQKNKVANVPSPSKKSAPDMLDAFQPSIPITNLKTKVYKRSNSNRIKDANETCNFSLVIFCDYPHQNWFIASRSIKSSSTASCNHIFHLPVNPKDITTSHHNMPIGIQKGLEDMLRRTGATNATIISYFSKNHDINLSPSLLSSYRNRVFQSWVDKLIAQDKGYVNASSIEKMITLMRGISNPSFVYMTHSTHSSLICHNKNNQTAYSIICDRIEKDINNWRKELEIGQHEDVLISFAWCHDDEKRKFLMFPKFISIDMTFGVNRERRNLVTCVGVDGNHKIFTGFGVGCLPNNNLHMIG